jgi:hypothetical protein
VACLVQANPGEPTIDGEKIKYGNGSLAYFDGVPFLKLAGSNYEMGLQYGVLMKERLQAMAASQDLRGIFPRIRRMG